MREHYMNGENQEYKAELMQKILEVRYTDLEQENALCKRLLGISEPEQDTYACAFANVYMVDNLLALGEFATCYFYMMRAELLCREYGYDELLLTLCNFAGLYYVKLNDEQTALQYFSEGLRLVKRTGSNETESKLLNNIGLCFARRRDFSGAKGYFYQACAAAKEIDPNLTSYRCNLAEVCQNSGDLEETERVLSQCGQIEEMGLYHKIRMGVFWCNYYALKFEREESIRWESYLAEIGFWDYENRYFIDDMCVGILESMLTIDDEERAGRYMKILEGRLQDAALHVRFQIKKLEVIYCEKYGDDRQRSKAYKEYAETERQITEQNNQARAQSILSRIQLDSMQMEREAMSRENHILEDESQLDQLTGLYNRRYFNKLITKTIQGENPEQLGFILLDVDFFKQYNDFYGHFEGDAALKAVACAIAGNVEEGIYASRYGGDEFVCLCVNIPDSRVSAYVQRVEETLREKRILHEGSVCGTYLSLSIGCCSRAFAKGEDTEALFGCADQALYQAKENGRNQHILIFS